MPHAATPILCALDFSEGSQSALVRAADLAERFHARLVLLYVDPLFRSPAGATPTPSKPDVALQQRLREFAEDALGGPDAVAVVGPEGVVRRGEYAADAILRQRDELDAGLVVVGTHGRRGVRRLLIGSVAEEVVRRAPCPVLVVPNASARTAPGPDAPVLVPVDFSDHTAETLDWAARMAGLYGAPVELLHVVEPVAPVPTFYSDVVGPVAYDASALVDGSNAQLRALAEGLDVDVETRTQLGAAHVAIVDVARERRAGLVVMATRGLTGLAHVALGSVAERTLRRAPCPVLVVRGATPIEDP